MYSRCCSTCIARASTGPSLLKTLAGSLDKTASAAFNSTVATSSCASFQDSELVGFPAYDQTRIAVRVQASAELQNLTAMASCLGRALCQKERRSFVLCDQLSCGLSTASSVDCDSDLSAYCRTAAWASIESASFAAVLRLYLTQRLGSLPLTASECCFLWQ